MTFAGIVLQILLPNKQCIPASIVVTVLVLIVLVSLFLVVLVVVVVVVVRLDSSIKEMPTRTAVPHEFIIISPFMMKS